MREEFMRNVAALFPIAVVATLAGCAGGPESRPGPSATPARSTPATPVKELPADRSLLADPAAPAVNRAAPEQYRVRFDTSKGPFVIEVRRDRAPRGADRFSNLVRAGFYDNARFFRVISGFMVQFGLSGDPAVDARWSEARIKDDPVRQSNTRGTVSFATSGPDSRTTQVFINFADNTGLDGSGFAPFGRVVEGMDVVDALYAGYGEGAPAGQGPSQASIRREGNAYLERSFPRLDFVKTARMLE
jgi:peptidyl-prolyl cis-trans isomerase A (cyclophilin A)